MEHVVDRTGKLLELHDVAACPFFVTLVKHRRSLAHLGSRLPVSQRLLIELQEHTLAAVLVVGLLSLVALVYLLTNFPMLVAAAMGLIAFVAAVIFSRRIREQQQQEQRD